MVWLYIVCFLAGILFTLGALSGAFLYTWRHKEKYGAAMLRHMMSGMGNNASR